MKDKIKVLLVSPYGENLTGGIANWTRHIVDYHRKSGIGIDLQLLDTSAHVQVTGADSIIRRSIVGLRSLCPIYKKYNDLLNKNHYDITHICTSASLGLIRDLLLVRAAKKRGVKTAVHMHFGLIPNILKNSGWEHYLFLYLMRNIDYAVVMDKRSMIDLKNAGFPNVKYLPNPLSIEVLNVIDKQGEVRREQRKVVYAGHVYPAKGVFELVEACREIANIKLFVLGKLTTDYIKEQLYECAGQNSDKWLFVLGNMKFEDVIKEMMSCSVFVLPSYSEGFPNVILESMACGCPIVATTVGAIPEMLNIEQGEENGICVKPQDVKSLKEAIERMLNDLEYAEQCGKNAKERVKELYGIENVWNQLKSIWEGCLN